MTPTARAYEYEHERETAPSEECITCVQCGLSRHVEALQESWFRLVVCSDKCADKEILERDTRTAELPRELRTLWNVLIGMDSAQYKVGWATGKVSELIRRLV